MPFAYFFALDDRRTAIEADHAASAFEAINSPQEPAKSAPDWCGNERSAVANLPNDVVPKESSGNPVETFNSNWPKIRNC